MTTFIALILEVFLVGIGCYLLLRSMKRSSEKWQRKAELEHERCWQKRMQLNLPSPIQSIIKD